MTQRTMSKGRFGSELACGCCLWPRDSDAVRKSQKIDKKLQKDKKTLKREVKLLLLGAGESGKSTFLKQMRIIHNYLFDREALQEFQIIIYGNIVKATKVLVDARHKLGIPWEDVHNDEDACNIMKFENSMMLDTKLFLSYVPSVKRLWNDRGIQEAYERRTEYQLGDSMPYFMKNLDRIATQDYVPTNQDILQARKATKGVSEFVIIIQDIPFRFTDVGGQRGQRKKWFPCFENVNAILFLVSSSEYDQVLLEDRKTNRLLDAWTVFETVVNNRYFVEVGFILFFNKMDLLREKLRAKKSCIKDYFTDFQGDPYDETTVKRFLDHMFISVRQNKNKLYRHFTTAIDTDNIKVVFTAVKDSILRKHIDALMLA